MELVEATEPDVVIVDIRMPPTHTDEGLRAAKAIRQRSSTIGILVLSQHVNARYALELLSDRTDRVGYLLKERVSDLNELAVSIERIGEGGSVLDPAVVAQLVGRSRQGDSPLDRLTDREREVLALMAEGRSNKAVGRHRAHGRETRQEHLRDAPSPALARRSPARPCCHHLPELAMTFSSRQLRNLATRNEQADVARGRRSTAPKPAPGRPGRLWRPRLLRSLRTGSCRSPVEPERLWSSPSGPRIGRARSAA
jgi:DNA-binding NarL/FixJ family response regulator